TVGVAQAPVGDDQVVAPRVQQGDGFAGGGGGSRLMSGSFQNYALQVGGVRLVVHAENSCHKDVQIRLPGAGPCARMDESVGHGQCGLLLNCSAGGGGCQTCP